MIKIKRTKSFSVKQATNMAKNLAEKHERPASIQVECPSYTNHKFWFYIEGTHNQYTSTWEGVQNLYEEWMK